MRYFKKLAAAACAIVVSIMTFAACKGDVPAPEPLPQEPISPSVSAWNPIDEANSIVTALADQTLKSKVTSADINAKIIYNISNTWIFENTACGALPPKDGTIEIVGADGKYTTSGAITDADKADANPKTLAERFSEDFGDVPTYALAHIEDGKVRAVIYTISGEIDPSELPPREVFFAESPEWTWNGEMAGVTPSGATVGTFPKIPLKRSQ